MAFESLNRCGSAIPNKLLVMSLSIVKLSIMSCGAHMSRGRFFLIIYKKINWGDQSADGASTDLTERHGTHPNPRMSACSVTPDVRAPEVFPWSQVHQRFTNCMRHCDRSKGGRDSLIEFRFIDANS